MNLKEIKNQKGPKYVKTSEELFSLHGRKVRLNYFGHQINDARVSINKDGSIHICQNDVEGGNLAENKFGYRQSLYIGEKTDSTPIEFLKIVLENRGRKPKHIKKELEIEYAVDQNPVKEFNVNGDNIAHVQTETTSSYEVRTNRGSSNNVPQEEFDKTRTEFVKHMRRQKRVDSVKGCSRDVFLILIGIGISAIAFLLGAYLTIIVR